MQSICNDTKNTMRGASGGAGSAIEVMAVPNIVFDARDKLEDGLLLLSSSVLPSLNLLRLASNLVEGARSKLSM
jgi:hypothetical protein